MTDSTSAASNSVQEREPARTPPDTLFGKLSWMAAMIHSPGTSRGDRAELRRMRLDEIPPEIYWRLTGMLNPVPTAREDEFWMIVMSLMVRYPHQPRARPGRVLRDAGVSPARLERWLRRDRDGAWKEAGRLLSSLKGASLDWGDFGSLLKRWDDEKIRRRLARDFFSRAGRTTTRNTEGDEDE